MRYYFDNNGAAEIMQQQQLTEIPYSVSQLSGPNGISQAEYDALSDKDKEYFKAQS